MNDQASVHLFPEKYIVCYAVVILIKLFLGIAGINGIEFYSVPAAILHSIIQLLPRTVGPEDQLVLLFLQGPEGLKGEHNFLSDLGVLVFYNGTIKVDGNLQGAIHGRQNLKIQIKIVNPLKRDRLQKDIFLLYRN